MPPPPPHHHQHSGSHGPCVRCGQHESFCFFVSQTQRSVLPHVWPIFQTSCRQWATPPAALSDFSSQVTALFSLFYGSCGLKPFQCSLTLCHCGEIVFSQGGKLEMDQCRGEAVTGVKRVSYAFSIQCPFLMEALPLLELIHGRQVWLTYPGSCRTTWNIFLMTKHFTLF